MNKLFNKKVHILKFFFGKRVRIQSFSVLVFSAVLLPCLVSASNVYLETAHKEFFVGDIILVDVKIASEDKEINTAEGKIFLDYLPDTILIKDINFSESSFPLWPNKPSLSDDLKTISFTGGVPNGLKHQNATLFKIALNLKNTGQVVLSPDDVSVYLNDGTGTKDNISVRNLTMNILPKKNGSTPTNDLSVLISEDKTPPLSFEIDAGQDDSVFDGKKFLSFSTIDEQSGIKYYEVREGDLQPTHSDGTYILQNQDAPTEVTVLAVDGSGNVRESVYTPPHTISYLKLIVGILLIILLFVILRARLQSRSKANKKSQK